jgi:Tfp pilus assembly protein PilN
LILSVAILSGLYAMHSFIIDLQMQSLKKNKDTAGRLAARNDELKRLQNDQEKLNQQQSALASIKSKNPPVTQIIYRLSAIMNDETWLSQLVIDPGEEQDKEARLILTGSSMSNERLGDFLSRLSAERSFKTVVLKFSSESEGDELSQKAASGRIRFQIICQIGKG